jgi:hypothetical protein
MQERLRSAGPAPYVGVTWRGGTPPSEQRSGSEWLLYKSVPIESLGMALKALPGTVLVLQRNPAPGELERFARALGRPVHDGSDLNADLEAMLALLACLDEYVAVSNTNVHLRAAAGRTARVLVPLPAEWRWMAGGDSSPWFPGSSVYRQRPSGDWSEALRTLREDLAAALDQPH